MKEQWIKLAARIDALSLRERGMVLAAAFAALVFLMYQLALAPQYARHKALRLQIEQQHKQAGNIDAEVNAKVAAFAIDPDMESRRRIVELRRSIETESGALRAVQHGLVAPQKMVPLLEQILRANMRLRLLSLKTLPVSGLSEPLTYAKPASVAPGFANATSREEVQTSVAMATQHAAQGAAAPSAMGQAKQRELLYRHGVELVLQGSYLDMLAYMEALERLPQQLFWGRAELQAGSYPEAKLTLTLYTLSLDDKWMTL
ncbi:type II secretion system protein M [Pseudoduganella violacea]|uniref:MSHA biogenesis protein MshJ n=1 Tax=Pseudoduganella violacea TaxID=1715466 RepID=A0A7W5BDN0_9BURK|nr:type II secretion system protein M [Pseudoduganella violacea]MBB3121244.1 MSHA biogenesis protein MshJ [Pseudoduganella violacea]